MLFSILAPIFLCMFFGYGSVRLNVLNSEQIKALGAFVIKVALPAYLLHALANKNLNDIWLPSYVIAYMGGSLILFAGSYLLYRYFFKNTLTQSAVLSMGAAMSNTGLIGTAILPLLIANHAVVYLSLTLIIENLVMITMVFLLAEMGLHGQQNTRIMLKRTLANLLKTPLIITIFIAFFCILFQFKLPEIVDEVLTMMGKTASPLALFVIGGSLVGLGFKAINLQVVSVVLSNILLMPLIIYGIFTVLPNVSDEMKHAGTLIAALPMPILFGIIGQIYGLEKQTLSALMLSTILGFIGTSLLIVWWW
ncbi:AEC family transporter [Acinetobacter sp. MD2(2019)]|uniref:AEC family transporter n=1 Tax=Acinetobacter sp. MD2(2019) TaxID=2605273 RepID=UPI002D1F6DD9|nr:AEC family transporter [Acinetobacter sp. MD2(2019)]MEB3753684.1 AEC family transporter [Acinetobacter sp. MD2(2019)]